MPSDPLLVLKKLTDRLENNDFENTQEVISSFRSQKDLLSELPTAFEAALESILERMESTAMFSEESCSFSQSDMVMALSIWLDKATSRLHKQMGLSDS